MATTGNRVEIKQDITGGSSAKTTLQLVNNVDTCIANAYTALSNKGATMPSTKNAANLATAINSLPTKATVSYNSTTNTLTITT